MQHIQLAAAHLVQHVIEQGRNLNQVLDETLRSNPHWKSAERGALQDLSFGTLRYYGQLRAVLQQLLQKPPEDSRVTLLLLVALYQLQYSQATQYTVVDQAVRAAHHLNSRLAGLCNAVLRNFLRRQDELLRKAETSLEGRYSHPQWWIKQLMAQYGPEVAGQILQAGNQHPPMTLRVNLRHHTLAEYQALLQHDGLAAQPLSDTALLLDKAVGVDELPGFRQGWVSVQDAGAQQAAGLLDVQDGMRVLDACAAPGGKTAHLLERHAIELHALDHDGKRLKRVADNLHRLQLSAKLLTGDAAQPATWWDGQPYQRILADVPCSASGVVRRHPDIKWLRRPEDLASFAAQQLRIVQALWPLLAPGGKLLYVTCSVFAAENEEVVSAFLAQQTNARRLPCAGQLLPSPTQDGFFYALLEKI